MNDEEYDYDFYDAALNDVLEEPEEVEEETKDETPEENLEESSEEIAEEISEEIPESTQETIQDVWIDNFDLLDTPLNSCSAVTISLLFILFFLALATIGGVIRD